MSMTKRYAEAVAEKHSLWHLFDEEDGYEKLLSFHDQDVLDELASSRRAISPSDPPMLGDTVRTHPRDCVESQTTTVISHRWTAESGNTYGLGNGEHLDPSEFDIVERRCAGGEA